MFGILIFIGLYHLSIGQTDIRCSLLTGVTRMHHFWFPPSIKEKLSPFIGIGFQYRVIPKKHQHIVSTIGVNVLQKSNVFKYSDIDYIDTSDIRHYNHKVKTSFMQIEMPVSIGYKFHKISCGVNSAVGINIPINSWNYWQETENGKTRHIKEEQIPNFKDNNNINPWSLSIGASGGYAISNSLDFRLSYSRTLTDFYHIDPSVFRSHTSRNNVYGLSITYKLKEL